MSNQMEAQTAEDKFFGVKLPSIRGQKKRKNSLTLILKSLMIDPSKTSAHKRQRILAMMILVMMSLVSIQKKFRSA
jgi:hypothetical protein